MSAIANPGSNSVAVPRKNVAGGGRTLLATDFGFCLDHSAASNWTLTLPTEAGAGFVIPEGIMFWCLSRSANFMKVQGANAGMIVTPYNDAAPVDAVYVSPQNGTAGFRYIVTGGDLWHVEGAHTIV